ncbi:MAG: tRNA pseudouridine(38-40) synthase TruA [Spirochaetes bacterium]|nr:tRNA pseudouridine(38-40) synthase TruA [Spirochaetota bacterium]
MRLKLLIEYDGSDYGGWQQQKNAKTIAGEILRVAGQIFPGVPLELHGAGRTDAGVHARGQVAHIDLPETLPLETLHGRMNDFLPADINLLKIEEVHARFHARHHAKARHYTYQISRRRDALNRRQVWWVKERLALALMGEAAAKLVGFHDFVSFSDEKPASPETAPDPARPNEKSTWVNLTHCGLVERDDLLLLEISGSHFLRKMVRRVVGNLVEVGTGKLSPAQMAAHLKTPSRVPAAHTAPPAGLFLTRVDY